MTTLITTTMLSYFLNKNFFKILQVRLYSQRFHYEIPSIYQNSFYMANATLTNNTNWFLQNALAVIYSELMEKLMNNNLSSYEAKNVINYIVKTIEPCSNFIDIQFPFLKSNGESEVIRGFRAEHGLHIKNRACLGGLRLCPDIFKSDIKALASIATYKYACLGLDLLGAHGAISISPSDFELDDLKKIIEKYVEEISKKSFCGESIDIFEPDMNCNGEDMYSIITANSRIGGIMNNCAVGKLESHGGLKNWEKAVGQGILLALDMFLFNQRIMDKIDLATNGLVNKTYILQGLGNVGLNTAFYLNYAKAVCVGIAEHDCFIYNPDGVDVEEAYMYKKRNCTLMDYKSWTKNKDLHNIFLETCDILVLAAIQRGIIYSFADKIKAKIIVEAANAPMSPCVHKILLVRNKLVLPDIYVNCGSSIASYIEYTKNLSNNCSEEINQPVTLDMKVDNIEEVSETQIKNSQLFHDLVNNSLEKNEATELIYLKLEESANDMLNIAEKYNLGLDLRTAAYIKCIDGLFWEVYKTTYSKTLI